MIEIIKLLTSSYLHIDLKIYFNSNSILGFVLVKFILYHLSVTKITKSGHAVTRQLYQLCEKDSQ